LSKPTTRRPAVASNSGPAPNTKRAGKARYPQFDCIHPFDAVSHCRQNSASKPNGIARTPRMPIGITQADTIGIAKRLASTP
jgi:hypothetical protein